MRGASSKVDAGVWRLFTAGAFVTCVAACSAGDGSGTRPPRPSGGDTSAGSTVSTGSGDTSGGQGGGAGIGTGSGGSPILSVPDAGHDAQFDPDAACTAEVREGERLPLDMYFLLD